MICSDLETIVSRRCTPHGIEDIMRRDRQTEVSDQCYRDSDVCSARDRDSDVCSERDRDSLSPLNLSVPQCNQAETDSYKMAARETESTDCRRKKMRTTFTGRQIFQLEKMFETKKYLNATERSSLSR